MKETNSKASALSPRVRNKGSFSSQLDLMLLRQRIPAKVADAWYQLKQNEVPFWQIVEKLTSEEVNELMIWILRRTHAESRSPLELRFLCAQFSQLEFFKKLTANYGDNVLQTCVKYLKYQEIPANCTVFSQGDRGTRFYVIISGGVDVLIKLPDKSNPSRFKDSLINTLRAGKAFGEVALMDENTLRTATIRTLDLTRFAYLEKEDFKRTMGFEATQKIQERYAFIKDYSFFDEFGYREIITFSYHFNEVHFKRGEFVYEAFDNSIDEVYFVKEGMFILQAALDVSQATTPGLKTKKTTKLFTIDHLVASTIFGLEFFNLDSLKIMDESIRNNSDRQRGVNNDDDEGENKEETQHTEEHPSSRKLKKKSSSKRTSKSKVPAQESFKPYRIGRVVCDSTRGTVYKVKASEIAQRLWRQDSKEKFYALSSRLFGKQLDKIQAFITKTMEEKARDDLFEEQGKYLKPPVEIIGTTCSKSLTNSTRPHIAAAAAAKKLQAQKELFAELKSRVPKHLLRSQEIELTSSEMQQQSSQSNNLTSTFIGSESRLRSSTENMSNNRRIFSRSLDHFPTQLNTPATNLAGNHSTNILTDSQLKQEKKRQNSLKRKRRFHSVKRIPLYTKGDQGEKQEEQTAHNVMKTKLNNSSGIYSLNLNKVQPNNKSNDAKQDGQDKSKDQMLNKLVNKLFVKNNYPSKVPEDDEEVETEEQAKERIEKQRNLRQCSPVKDSKLIRSESAKHHNKHRTNNNPNHPKQHQSQQQTTHPDFELRFPENEQQLKSEFIQSIQLAKGALPSSSTGGIHIPNESEIAGETQQSPRGIAIATTTEQAVNASMSTFYFCNNRHEQSLKEKQESDNIMLSFLKDESHSRASTTSQVVVATDIAAATATETNQINGQITSTTQSHSKATNGMNQKQSNLKLNVKTSHSPLQKQQQRCVTATPLSHRPRTSYNNINHNNNLPSSCKAIRRMVEAPIDEDLIAATSLEDYQRRTFSRSLKVKQEKKFMETMHSELMEINALDESSEYTARMKAEYMRNKRNEKCIFNQAAKIVKQQNLSFNQVREYFNKLNHRDRLFQDMFISKNGETSQYERATQPHDSPVKRPLSSTTNLTSARSRESSKQLLLLQQLQHNASQKRMNRTQSSFKSEGRSLRIIDDTSNNQQGSQIPASPTVISAEQNHSNIINLKQQPILMGDTRPFLEFLQNHVLAAAVATTAAAGIPGTATSAMTTTTTTTTTAASRAFVKQAANTIGTVRTSASNNNIEESASSQIGSPSSKITQAAFAKRFVNSIGMTAVSKNLDNQTLSLNNQGNSANTPLRSLSSTSLKSKARMKPSCSTAACHTNRPKSQQSGRFEWKGSKLSSNNNYCVRLIVPPSDDEIVTAAAAAGDVLVPNTISITRDEGQECRSSHSNRSGNSLQLPTMMTVSQPSPSRKLEKIDSSIESKEDAIGISSSSVFTNEAVQYSLQLSQNHLMKSKYTPSSRSQAVAAAVAIAAAAKKELISPANQNQLSEKYVSNSIAALRTNVHSGGQSQYQNDEGSKRAKGNAKQSQLTRLSARPIRNFELELPMPIQSFKSVSSSQGVPSSTVAQVTPSRMINVNMSLTFHNEPQSKIIRNSVPQWHRLKTNPC